MFIRTHPAELSLAVAGSVFLFLFPHRCNVQVRSSRNPLSRRFSGGRLIWSRSTRLEPCRSDSSSAWPSGQVSTWRTWQGVRWRNTSLHITQG